MGVERWSDAEKQAAMEAAFGANGDSWRDEHPVGANYELRVFVSRREYRRKRKNPREVILIARRNGAEPSFYEYTPGEMRGEIDDLANDLKDELPPDRDPYDALVEWIESEVKRAREK